MKSFEWDKTKNIELKLTRKISFEDIIFSLREGNLLDDIKHPNPKKYPNQKVLIVNFNDYAYLVPYVEEEDKFFLKTIIPSRKMTKKYLR